MDARDAALKSLYKAHAHELHGFARRRVGRQEAEDVVQDAYLHLLQRGMIAGLEHPRAYLFRIAANLAVDAARKTKTRSRYAEDEIEFLGLVANSASPEATVEGAMELRLFHASLSELPPLCRTAFLLNRVDELTHAEIAKRLGVSVRTIDRHMAKAVAHLRRRLHRFAEEASRGKADPARISIGQSA
ncbi:RNA polymerase sigma factor [Methylocapsa acidiphila]|uniref:RNA polymerase sigma factor n=1 Tax=Methylocapsa acidiphila TaxID=133552 RepID=UPI000422C8E9|nr:sigma-70 family RNA polymerase sigma factor [Methylocapsa acidiphila]